MLLDYPVFLYDGPMETRIEYGTDLKLDAEMSIFTLAYSAPGRQALSALYRRDAEAAARHGLPIVLNAPTYRASPAHAQRLGYSDVGQINRDALALVREAVAGLASPAPILVTAAVGPRYAAYRPDLDHTVEEAVAYHTPQMEAVSGADLISIAAMHSSLETLGAAIAASRTGQPYTVGFVLTPEGNLLDGSPAAELMARVDELSPRPEFFVMGCTHPSVCRTVLEMNRPEFRRFLGIKANGSNKTPEELLALDHAEADPPEEFAEQLLALGQPRGFRIYGGCCGTDTALIDCLGKRLRGR